MSSVREQILGGKVMTKLEAVRTDLGWGKVIRNPRDEMGEEDLPAIVLMDGGERQPDGMTGHVDDRWLEFTVGLFVLEQGGKTLEQLLDEGLVAVTDALIDPQDIQLGGLAVGIEQGETSDPVLGRLPGGARYLGAISMDFSVRYMAREGDASTPAP